MRCTLWEDTLSYNISCDTVDLKYRVGSGFDTRFIGCSPGGITNIYLLHFQSYNNCNT
jgi:hypothetical protein